MCGVLIIAFTGCGGPSDNDDEDGGVTLASTTTITSPTTSTTTVPADAAGPDLVGTWSTADELIEIVYRFHDDGTYESAHVMTQPVPGGVSSLQVAAAGTYTLEGDEVVLVPEEGYERRTDPGDPVHDYDRPVDTTPERQRWSFEPGPSPDGDVLTLVTPEGVPLTFERS